jgi:hypothetical protein
MKSDPAACFWQEKSGIQLESGHGFVRRGETHCGDAMLPAMAHIAAAVRLDAVDAVFPLDKRVAFARGSCLGRDQSAMAIIAS